jgi:hypothetical protein
MLRAFGFGVYGFGVYGGVPSLDQFVFFVPQLNVIRDTSSPFHATIDVTNPPDNGSLIIYRGDDVRSGVSELATVALTSLPYTDSTANPILNHKYVGRYFYNFNGRLVTGAPLSAPAYTYLESNTI